MAPSPLPRTLLQLLRRSPVTVFVVGGTGPHREQTARRLHEESVVHDGPFVHVDCGEQEPELRAALEAWLSGRPGEAGTDPVVSAGGGTLFLDGIEALEMETQRLLLGLALQRKERGSYPGRPRWAARLIVGNARDVFPACREGRFHVALYDLIDQYRVNVG